MITSDSIKKTKLVLLHLEQAQEANFKPMITFHNYKVQDKTIRHNIPNKSQSKL